MLPGFIRNVKGSISLIVVWLQKRLGCKPSKKWSATALRGLTQLRTRGFGAWLQGQLGRRARLTVDSFGRFAAITNISGLTQLKVSSLPSKAQNSCSAGWAPPLQVVIRDPGSFHLTLSKGTVTSTHLPLAAVLTWIRMNCKGIWEMWSRCSQEEEAVDLMTS